MKYNVAETDDHFFVTALNDNVKLQNYNTSNLEFICQDKTKTSIMDSISMKWLIDILKSLNIVY